MFADRSDEHGFALYFAHKKVNDENNEPQPIKNAGGFEKVREPLSDEKIKDLAKKMYRNEIFTSMQINEHDLNILSMIFMPLSLMDEICVMDFKLNKIAHVCAYIGEHCGRSINEYPTFHSVYTLTADESEKLYKKWLEIIEMMEGI